jgi:membrane protein implicated in regulation of membrane protease activity
MNIVLKVILISFGVFMFFMGAIFLIAAVSPDLRLDILIQGLVFLFIGGIPIIIVVYLERKEASRPVMISRNINIEGSDLVGGRRKEKDIRCRGCSGSLSADDVRITDLGIMIKCPYCGKAYTIEEEPKW